MIKKIKKYFRKKKKLKEMQVFLEKKGNENLLKPKTLSFTTSEMLNLKYEFPGLYEYIVHKRQQTMRN